MGSLLHAVRYRCILEDFFVHAFDCPVLQKGASVSYEEAASAAKKQLQRRSRELSAALLNKK